MGREEASFVDEDVFEAAVNDDEYDADISGKDGMTNRDGSPIAKRRMIEAMLEERRLRKQIEDDFNFDDDD
jgi:hypothetical protein